MTLLSTCQSVAPYIGIAEPDAIVTSSKREHKELLEFAREMAARIAKGHDWQVLSVIGTITGDGTKEGFDMPDDYDRMLVKSEVWSSSLQTPLSHILDLDEWLGLDIQSFDFVVNAWTLYGGQMQLKPALATGVTAKYFYQSSSIVRQGSSDLIEEFAADTDTFRLNERLLKLGIIWRWKEAKGQDYAEPMEDYEELKERLIAKDKGSRMITVGRSRRASGASTAYPQSVGLP